MSLLLSEEVLDLSKLRLNIAKELSLTIDELVEVRQGSDYDDFYIISKNEVEQQLLNAEIFVNEIEKYLLTVY